MSASSWAVSCTGKSRTGRKQVRVEGGDLFQCFRAVVMEVGSGLLHAPERWDLEEAGEERRVPNERRWHTRWTRIRQRDPRIRRPDGLHVSESIIDQECVFGQVQEVPLADADVRDACAGGRTEVEPAGLIEHGTGMTQGADALSSSPA